MQIKEIKINNFGKLTDKEIKLEDGINVIYGENESGKSTLLKFITSIFYGISKNKNGQKISDYDKYTPWKEGEFSGKIDYVLDNNEEYEVYRNFYKKNPQVFDKSGNDISKNYAIDKTYGNQYFSEQTKVDEELFNMSQVIAQQEVKLDEKKQNTLIQKASNIMLTGEDDISYKTVLSKLNKRQTDEIGTLKSPTKPLYLVTKKIEELTRDKEELEEIEPLQYEIEDEKNSLLEKISEAKKELEILQELQKVQDNEKIEEEKININKTAQDEIKMQRENLEESLNQIKLEKGKKSSKITYIISIILLIIGLILYFINQKIVGLSLAGIAIVVALVGLILNLNKNKAIKKANEQKEREIEQIKTKIELLENEIKEKEKVIQSRKDEIKINTELQKSNLKNRFSKLQNVENILNNKLENRNIIEEQNLINELKLELTKLEMRQNEGIKKLENLTKIEEELENLKEEYQNLIEYNESIEIAKEALEDAYLEMREKVTPKFTVDLSEAIKNISSGKYKSVKVNEENGLMVETENGNYVSANVLSVGTVDELYLSLRISSINELVKENMPIILDETFAYFDQKRLENVLEFLNKNYGDRQIIILTCTNRECNALENKKIQYNKIVLTN